MEHVVFYPDADGAEVFRRAADLEEAVRLVERLRNDLGVGDASVFALHPVPLAFRTYVHVELPVAQEQAEAAIPPPPSEAPAAPELAAEPGDEADHDSQLADLEAPDAEPLEDQVSELAEPGPESNEVEAEVEVEPAPLPPPPPGDFFERMEDFEPTFFEDVQDVEDVEDADPAPLEAVQIELPEPADVDGDPSSAAAPAPLVLAPGPLLLDGEDTPIGGAGSYDAIEEPAGELTDLIPADFTDLIPRDIVHGDLAKAADQGEPVGFAELSELSELAAASGFAQPAESSEPSELAESAELEAEPAPSTEDLPPMDLEEVPSDLSSIALEAAPIPAARENAEQPVTDGPRGLGYFGG